MKDDEIVSFNQELVSMDLEDMTVEQLEQRLELAVIVPVQCGSFSGPCGTFHGGCITFG